MLTLVITFAFISAFNCFELQNEFRIGYIENPAGVIVSQDENNITQVTGCYVDLAKWIAADNKKSYSLIQLDYTGSFETVSDELSLKSIDFALPTFGITAERTKFATFLVPVATDEHTLLLPYPKRASDPSSCLKPFSFTVWLCTAVCIIVIPILLKNAADVKKTGTSGYKMSGFASFSDTSMYVIGVITNQGGYLGTKTRATRFISAIWCLAAIVLVNAYSSLLITYLTAPKVSLLVQSVEELANRDDIQVLAVQGTFVRRYLENAEGLLKPIRANMERIPEDYCGSRWDYNKVQDCARDVANGGFVLVESKDRAEGIMGDEFKETRTCKLTYLQNSFLFISGAFVIPLNASHKLRNTLDVSILKAISYGLVDKFNSLYYAAGKSPCSHFRSNPSQELKKLSLVDFTSAYILLGIGYVLSFVAFSYEVFAGRRLKQAKVY